tara:strand:- start:1041 stop:1514 length:474 start_codon:yes stop_codon:yes gene_type:complete
MSASHASAALPSLLSPLSPLSSHCTSPLSSHIARLSLSPLLFPCAQAKQEEHGLSHRTYRAVAETLVALSANKNTAVPPDLHMTVREIYKTCYPGFGAGTGSGAYAPGLQAGGSSTKASTSGSMVGKGAAKITDKVTDENMRKRLDTLHDFMILIKH